MHRIIILFDDTAIRKLIIIPILSICITMFSPLSAFSSIVVTDLDLTDSFNIEDVIGPVYTDVYNITETFQENTLIPYNSNGGNAIVNSSLGFFDTTIELGSWTETRPIYIAFIIYNKTDYVWSDFHLEFYEDDQVTPLNVENYLEDFGSDYFQNKSCSGNVIEFWQPDSWPIYILTDPPSMDAGHIAITLDTPTLYNIHPKFMVRQVATVVPIPSAVWLLTSGLIGLIGVRRKFRKR